MNQRKEILLGFGIGILLEIILCIILYFSFNPGNLRLSEYFNFFANSNLLVPVLTISLLANFALFFLLLKFNKDYISKGIMIATMIIGVLIIIIKVST